MELRLLRYFTAVCQHGSLHAAAAVVHVAQPSLSRQIRRLEKDLGFALFDRSSRGLTLTAAGRAFLPVARDLLARDVQASATAEAIARGRVANLTVVSAATTVADIIAPFVVRAGQDGVIGNVVEAYPEHVYGALWNGDADFAVGTRIPPTEHRSRVIGHAYLWAQVPPGHPLAQRAKVTITELMSEPLIVLSETHGVRRMFDTAAARAGLSYTAAVETESPSLAQALAAAGRGVCILSDDSRYGLISVPIVVPDGSLIITLFGVWDPLHFASAQIADTLDGLSSFIAELYPQVTAGSGQAFPRRDTSGASNA